MLKLKLQGVQLEAGRARTLRIEALVELGQRDVFVQAALLVAPIHQARAAPVQFILQNQRERVEEGFLVGLGLQHAHFERGADTGHRRSERRARSISIMFMLMVGLLLAGWADCAGVDAEGEQVRVVVAIPDQGVLP
jgi:hypothetical protein